MWLAIILCHIVTIVLHNGICFVFMVSTLVYKWSRIGWANVGESNDIQEVLCVALVVIVGVKKLVPAHLHWINSLWAFSSSITANDLTNIRSYQDCSPNTGRKGESKKPLLWKSWIAPESHKIAHSSYCVAKIRTHLDVLCFVLLIYHPIWFDYKWSNPEGYLLNRLVTNHNKTQKVAFQIPGISWWRHQMETFSA